MLAKLRAADSRPGVLDVIGDAEYFLFGGHEERGLRGDPGAVVARREGAICRATIDGAVWIPQMRGRPAPDGPATFKVPATLALGGSVAGVPEVTAPLAAFPGLRTYREISYREANGVGYLEFYDQPGEGFLAKAGRLGEARHRAEQIVLPEDILLAPEPGADQDQENPRQDPAWGLELLTAEDPEE